ncbi:MAG TPA: DUF4097 family beta strand repeat-containing protein [Pyrinomonadaceae bacterium]
MLRKALITATVVLAALITNGTASVSANDPKRHQNPNVCPAVESSSVAEQPREGEQELREDFHQTYPLSATGRVILENLNGGVQIRVWDRPAVQVDAVKRAHRRDRLAEARVEVNASEGVIRIKTEYPDWNQTFRSDERRYDNPAIVDYSLTVPRKAILESIELVNGSIDIDGTEGNVKASSINGRVIARGLQGEVRISTINGSLQATFAQLNESNPISLTSVNGNLTLIIPSNANAAVRANTVHGAISNDFGIPVRHGEYVGHDLSGQIGSGGPRIKLVNVNGSIRITHQQDGLRVNPARSLIETAQVKEVEPATAEAIADAQREAREAIREAAREIREANREAAREAREAVREAQRRDVVLREAQREVARAQAEVQREVTRAPREDIRIRRGVGVGVGVGSGYGGRFTSQESKSFPVSGSPRINISTFDGSITVHAWDKPEVMFTATKRAEEDAYLKNIVIKSEQLGSTISIIAKSDELVGSANLEVYVPRRSSLHVSSDDGGLSLVGVSGDITLRTGDGAIEVRDAGGQLQVNTGDGQINVRNFEGQVDARTGDGAISLDGIFNSVMARTGDGAISLAVPSGSNFTVETNASDTVINEGLLLTEDITPTQRVRRWRIGNGGQIFVLNTGDGRIVVRSR